MKRQLKKWSLRIAATGLLIAILLVTIILKPVLTYANYTKHGNYIIFHNKAVDQALLAKVDDASGLVSASELYNAKLELDICLNDGSSYPKLMQAMRGQAFAWGFYDKVVLIGNANYKDNYVELNGYKWNLTQLLAHEMVHCFQYEKLGFLKSYPVANTPVWKWEGYPEYVARQDVKQKSLVKNIERLIACEKTNNNGWINFPDSTGTVIPYYKYWLLVQYSIKVKQMTFARILEDTTSEKVVQQQMMNWYIKQKENISLRHRHD